MINLQLGNVFTDCSGEPEDAVRDILRFKHPNASYMDKYRLWINTGGKAGWDGYLNFYSKVTKKFQTGLVPYLCKKLDKIQVKFELTDLRDRPILEGNGKIPGVELHQHQVEGIGILSNRFENIRWNRGIFDHCTSSGKTLLAATLIKRINQDTLYIVPKKDLMVQTAKVLSKALGEPVGMMGDAYFDTGKKFTVATANMLMSRLLRKNWNPEVESWVGRKKVLIIDEVHHIGDNKWYEVVKNVPAYYRFGFSATPFKKGEIRWVNLVACTGDPFSTIKTAELIEKGILAKIEVLLHEVTVPYLGGLDYQDAYNEGIVNNLERNKMIAQLAYKDYKDGRNILILVSRLRHGGNIQSALANLGLKVRFIRGATGLDARREFIEHFAQKRIAIASTIWDEGVDAPAIDSLSLAGGGKNERRTIQRVGRGLRKKEGRNLLTVHAFVDRTNEYLLDHSKQTIATFKREKWPIKNV